MKKLLFISLVLLFTAASCNKSVVKNNEPNSNIKQTINTEPSVSGTAIQNQTPDTSSSTQKITELQKQVDDLKKQNKKSTNATPPVNITPPAPSQALFDLCNNIEGAQTTIPNGMMRTVDNNCVIRPPETNTQPVQPEPSPTPTPTPTPTPAPASSQEDIDHLARLQTGNQVLSEVNSYLTNLNSQISQTYSQLQALQVRMDPKTYAGGGTMSSYYALLSQLTPQYNSLVATYNSMLETKGRLATIVYEVKDYQDSGILVPAQDRAYLLQIGIAWPIN